LIISENKKDVKGKRYMYKATAKALTIEPDDLEKLTNITKRLITGENISNEEERWLEEKCQL